MSSLKLMHVHQLMAPWSSFRIERTPAHVTLSLWIDGAKAGNVTVGASQAEDLRTILAPLAVAGPMWAIGQAIKGLPAETWVATPSGVPMTVASLIELDAKLDALDLLGAFRLKVEMKE